MARRKTSARCRITEETANGTLEKSDESNGFVLYYLARHGAISDEFDEPFPNDTPELRTGRSADWAMRSSGSNS